MRIVEQRTLLGSLGKALGVVWEKQAERRKGRVRSAMALLDSLSPLAVLRRGYSITQRLPDGLILRRADSAVAGQDISIMLSAGRLQAKITRIFKEQSDGEGKI